ncbi:MAG TPA: pyridoxamine 5'-phosphate oxidase family protein [Longimicrobium sp.]|nr:pyridoxamine 5'-phosphate oxidase family protein [Longimicrobium sp.]
MGIHKGSRGAVTPRGTTAREFMGKVVECITEELRAFIEAQPLFFVATAPLSPAGHVNLSPKGLDCFRVLSPTRVAYLDLTGSGNETAAHLQENARITFMFCAFGGPPRILRLYGTGGVVLPGHTQWAELAPLFPEYPGVRQIVVADVERVQTSCGFAVPLMEYVGQRDTLLRWAEAKGDDLGRYRQEKNSRSIDGLPTPYAGAPA